MRRWYEFDRWGHFPPSRPLEAKGGIRAQSKRGKFGESWWAKRWIAVLDSFDIGARLQRGRSYARRGQVLSIEIAKGSIEAKVQGSRPLPYEIAIEVKVLPEKDWAKVAQAVSTQAVFASKLLAGEMPNEMEDVFRDVKVSLFPEHFGDLATECSCPDWSNPCKHIAAVYYLLGEEFDRDPFLIFKMRGIEREEFLRLLGESATPDTSPAGIDNLPPEPLPSDPALFWATSEIPPDLTGEPPPHPVGAALPKRLGKFPFWRGAQDLVDFLEQAYHSAGAKASELLARS